MSSVVFILRVYRILYGQQSKAARTFFNCGCSSSPIPSTIYRGGPTPAVSVTFPSILRAVSRAFGDAWLKTNNLPALRVPTVITPGEWNVLVSPVHPQFSLKWVVTGPHAYTFDARLLPVKKGIRSRRTPRDQ
jgi:hypothetical protein